MVAYSSMWGSRAWNCLWSWSTAGLSRGRVDALKGDLPTGTVPLGGGGRVNHNHPRTARGRQRTNSISRPKLAAVGRPGFGSAAPDGAVQRAVKGREGMEQPRGGAADRGHGLGGGQAPWNRAAAAKGSGPGERNHRPRIRNGPAPGSRGGFRLPPEAKNRNRKA